MGESFKKLIEEIKKCEICNQDLPLGPNPILQANMKAKLLIAGQAPGKKVHSTSIPFDDPSGDRLREWMAVDKNTFYDSKKIAIVPMGFCYPGTGKSGDFPPRPECAETWHNRLLKKLKNVELILVIGQYAQEYYLKETRKKTLTETVKAWKEFWPEYLPLPHPSPRNNIWLKKNPWFLKDVIPELQKKVKQLIKFAN